MVRIGPVELHKRVAAAAEKTGLPLHIAAFPVPPHQVMVGDIPITGRGSSTKVAKEFEFWLDGFVCGTLHNK